MPFEKGQLVADKYVIEEVIGAGGVGVVVSARHTKLGEKVAIKFLQSAAMQSAENVARFDREARSASKIKNEHVARVIDVGSLPNGAPYMVLEHLEGQDLGAVLRDRHHLPVEEAVDYVAQACEAVMEAHALGIVHRDLKPANLFLTKRADGSPIIKVLDFGISKLLARSGSSPELSMTQTASIMGSPLYMSPEQMTTPRDTNELTDVWSLGTILYELLTGLSPFEAATLPALCARICTGAPTPISQRLPEGETIPPALEGAIMRCLERDRGARHNTVADLARRIAPFGSRDATQSADHASRVAQTAGIPLSFDDDDDLTQVAKPQPSKPPPGGADRESLHLIDTVPSNGDSPTASESRPVSFVPRPRRFQTPTRLLVALAAVLFVGTLIGAEVSARRNPAPEQIVGRAARTVAREAELVAGGMTRPATSALPPPVETAITALPAATAIAAESATASTDGSAAPADSAKPKTKKSSSPPSNTTRKQTKQPTDNILTVR